MQREQKIWGERWIVRIDSGHANSILHIKAGYRCSWHCHQSKFNKFVVISGRLGIKTNEGEIELTAGKTCTVPPHIAHEFRAYEDTICVEEMYVEYDEQDIKRSDLGGEFTNGTLDNGQG